MNTALHDRMGGYILAHHPHPAPGQPHTRCAVTISREAGAGGSSVAMRLAEYLDRHQPKGERTWEVFDHNLVEKALEQHRLPAHYKQYLPEDVSHFLPDTVEDLLGLHPAASQLVRRVSETMLGLARHGHVILVGRGGNVITARLRQVVNVRLVAPRAARIRHIEQKRNLSHAEAAAFVDRTDRGRKRFLRQNFGARVDDPAIYDLVINTGRISFEEAAALIGTAVLARMSAAPAAGDEAGELLARSRLTEA